MMIAIQAYLLALTSALYLLRGMLELPELGWRFEVKLTAIIGVVVLPALVGVAAADAGWGRWLIAALSVIGCLINIILLIRLWRGLASVAVLTGVICIAYLAISVLALT